MKKLIKFTITSLVLATSMQLSVLPVVAAQTNDIQTNNQLNLKDEVNVYKSKVDVYKDELNVYKDLLNKKDIKLNPDGTIKILGLDKLSISPKLKDSTEKFIENVNLFIREGSMSVKSDLMPYATPDKLKTSIDKDNVNTTTSGAVSSAYASFDLNSKCWNNRQTLQTYYDTTLRLAAQSGSLNPAGDAAAGCAVYFVGKVKTGGAWDYKATLGGATTYSVMIGSSQFYITGEDIGNIHFGYVGRVIFTGEQLKYGAGFAQLYSNITYGQSCSGLNKYWDNPNDTPQIQRGINWYDSGTFH